MIAPAGWFPGTVRPAPRARRGARSRAWPIPLRPRPPAPDVRINQPGQLSASEPTTLIAW